MGASVPPIDDLDSLLEGFDEPSKPINSASSHSVSVPRMGQPWLGIAAFAVALVVLAISFLPKSTPNDDSTVKVDKPHVVIVEESGDHDQLTANQIAILTSVPIREFYDRNEVVYRKYDVEDDVSKESKTLQELREMVTEEPPCVIVAKGSKASQFKLPKDPEAMQKRVSQLIKGM